MTAFDRDDIENRFGFHKGTIEGENATAPKHRDLRIAFMQFAEVLAGALPAGNASGWSTAATATTGESVAWAPSDLAGITAWWDASDAATITDTAGAVSALADKSGNGYTLSQGAAGALPAGRAKSMAFTELEAASMWAHKAARRAWTREARANVKLKKKLKKQKKIFRQLWKGTKEVTAELDQKVAQLWDAETELDQIHIVIERRDHQIRGLRKEVIELKEKNLMLAEKVDQLERGVTEVKSDPEFDWQGEFERERNRREFADEVVLSLRSKVDRLEKALRASRPIRLFPEASYSSEFPPGTLITYPNGTELRFLDRARSLFARN